MVGRDAVGTQQQTAPDSPMGLHHRIRCFIIGVGSQLQWDQYRWCMDPGGTLTSHQLSGASGCISGSEIIYNQPRTQIGATLDGKFDRNSFSHPNGGTHSLPLSELAVEVWEWCIQRGITIHAKHLPGVKNV